MSPDYMLTGDDGECTNCHAVPCVDGSWKCKFCTDATFAPSPERIEAARISLAEWAQRGSARRSVWLAFLILVLGLLGVGVDCQQGAQDGERIERGGYVSSTVG